MPTSTDDFAATWQSLSDTHRSFLLAVYDIDKRLPHSDGLDKVLPAIRWRTVGVMCGMRSDEVDELVRTLTASRLVYVLDAQRYEMGLICRHHLRELLDAQRRKRWNWITLAAAVLTAIATHLCLSPA